MRRWYTVSWSEGCYAHVRNQTLDVWNQTLDVWNQTLDVWNQTLDV